MKNEVLNINFFLILFVFFTLLNRSDSFAQNFYKVKGNIKDSTKNAIQNAEVSLITGKDTLHSKTDTAGVFKFMNVRSNVFLLKVYASGYDMLGKEYHDKTANPEILIPTIHLQIVVKQLKEVEIKGKSQPVRFKRDTVEFDALAYAIHDRDRVSDLMRQLPGVDIDRDGNASYMGKTLTKIRVNGKDFFSGNVKQFISQLPAGIVGKLQIIDDYGDVANFTGIKNGDGSKMLNLVIKDGMDSGDFGLLSANYGTNDRYGAGLNSNLWRGSRQISLNGNTSKTSGIGGNLKSTDVSLNYRDNVGANTVLSGAYNYGYSQNSLRQQSYLKTVSPMGDLFNISTNDVLSKTHVNNVSANLNYGGKGNLLQIGLRGLLPRSSSEVQSMSKQTGVIRQDLSTESLANQNSPNLSADILVGHQFKKAGRNLSLSLSAGTALADTREGLDNDINYYEGNSLIKDSVLNRLIDIHNRNNNFGINLTFSEPIRIKDDKRSSLDFNYSFSSLTTTNKQETSVKNHNTVPLMVDSLTSISRTSFSNHLFGLFYRYSAKKINYSTGLNIRPNKLKTFTMAPDKNNSVSGLNVSPVLRFDYTPSERNSWSANYNGSNTAPNINQLQPVRDIRNLQNIIVGNPDLKTSFTHFLNLNYRHNAPDSRNSIQVVLTASLFQNQIVTNSVLVNDTLNSFRQETHFLNTNGNYTTGVNYYLNIRLADKKYSLNVKGGANYDRRVSFSENLRNIGQAVNLNQGVGIQLNQKWLTVTTDANYIYRTNQYSISGVNKDIVQTWIFTADSRIFISEKFKAGTTISKTVNNGFALHAVNPLIIGGYVEQLFFRSRILSLKLEAYDILNQANGLSRSVSGNTTLETKNELMSRYFLISLDLRFEKFGIQ
ncbi:TonB-dependent receptor [Pedobacter hartonius]|uniref:Outer membrane receptor proteins, mostly Fe transport n=1 Tax=Pedobacter hartonius TaxID=425514 RepID=A0A1H4FVI5_9SPHI|nr:TonB-dependent receptor [Pedobacter hartonius]SEB01294.1 Outer membrane receptor proteins, mostly Fe transport [Pedobacter hartonius]